MSPAWALFVQSLLKASVELRIQCQHNSVLRVQTNPESVSHLALSNLESGLDASENKFQITDIRTC